MRLRSILGLMTLVAVAAVAIAAHRNADDYWAGGLLLATPGLLCVALVGAVCGVPAPRPRPVYRSACASAPWSFLATGWRNARSTVSFGSVETGPSRHSHRIISGRIAPPNFCP